MVKRAAFAAAAVLVLLVVYALAVEPRFVLDERTITAELPGLDESWEGEQVAVFSDIQTGMWLANTGMVERVVDRVVEVDPAAVLLVGDFVYSTSPDVPEQVRNVVELLRPIAAAGIPACAVLATTTTPSAPPTSSPRRSRRWASECSSTTPPYSPAPVRRVRRCTSSGSGPPDRTWSTWTPP